LGERGVSYWGRRTRGESGGRETGGAEWREPRGARRGEADTRARARGARGAPQRQCEESLGCRVVQSAGCLGSQGVHSCRGGEMWRIGRRRVERRAERGSGSGSLCRRRHRPRRGLSRCGMVTALGRAGCLLPSSLDALSLPLAGFLYLYSRTTGDGRPGFDPRARASLCATQRSATRRDEEGRACNESSRGGTGGVRSFP
jgi:hypothetical protein